MKKGFTLIELLVVIGMIAILTGAASSSVMKARKRSQIARAETEVREMTNAILAYENYAERHELPESGWTKADSGNLKFILGDAKDGNGNPVPVLYNASVAGNGMLLDPWGKQYEFMIVKAGEAVKDRDEVGKGTLETFLYVPNRYWPGVNEQGVLLKNGD